MKKNYQKPQMEVVNVNMSSHILAGSLTSVGGNVFEGTISGGSGTARSRYLDELEEWE
jgi:hypothetical protein